MTALFLGIWVFVMSIVFGYQKDGKTFLTEDNSEIHRNK